MQGRYEVHISGATFSHIVSSVLSLRAATKRNYALFGHYELGESDTDTTENSTLLQIAVTTIVPLEVPPPPGAVFLGYVSARKCAPHKLSFEDTRLLLGENNEVDSRRESGVSAYPLLLLLVTASPDSSPTNGTSKLDYSVFRSMCPADSGKSLLTNKNVIPLKVDNMIDSLSGFLSISCLGCHNPSDGLRFPSCRNCSVVAEAAFEQSVSTLKDASSKLQLLLQRLTDMEKALSGKKRAH
ncbi:uncharacterized protein Tco025E_07437 [Trypanosoma conorhini]|uniref:Uncharacterized protein n=1 Tax=Trypanosoma conorhini TaxID=83891 RepID=A0A3R7MRV0_9TRYP|nr:uncharacterized protein Tco025E_07437 [Trypanosoma conorhini]RNF07118.1 hypothetical protein Tco025E_07437 [Trypanosoma conorhini]